MEFKLDRNKKYALALKGGGAKGSYEVGVWDAIAEEGLKIKAVSGTSIGSINGALIAMDELEMAKKLWGEITYSDIMNVDNGLMRNLIKKKYTEMNIKETAKVIKDVVANKGFDVGPILTLFDKYIDEDRIRKSPIDFYIVTYSLSEMEIKEFKASELGDGEIHEMMLASSYLPVFKNEKLGGKRYVDGGIADNLPIHVLLEHGQRDIIAVEMGEGKLWEKGLNRKVKLPDDATVWRVKPTEVLGNSLDFDPEIAKYNMKLGYYDGKKMMYGLCGRKYYLEKTMDEKEVHDIMVAIVESYFQRKGKEISLREINEKVLTRLATTLKCEDGDYYDLFIGALEAAALEGGVERFVIRTDAELLRETQKCFDLAGGDMPKSYFSFFQTMMNNWEQRNAEV